MTDRENTRTIHVRIVHRDNAPTTLREALTRPQTPISPPVTVAQLVAREQAEK